MIAVYTLECAKVKMNVKEREKNASTLEHSKGNGVTSK